MTPNLLSSSLLTYNQAQIANLFIHLVLYVYFSPPLTFSGTFPLVSDLANGSRRCAIEDARFVPLLPTARRGKRSLQKLSDIESGDLAKNNHHFFFSIASDPLLHANVILPLGVQIQPAYLPQRG